MCSQCTSYISLHCFSAWYVDLPEQQIDASVRLLPAEAENIGNLRAHFSKESVQKVLNQVFSVPFLSCTEKIRERARRDHFLLRE